MDGRVDLSDSVLTLRHLFLAAPSRLPRLSGQRRQRLADRLRPRPGVTYLFLGASPLPDPSPSRARSDETLSTAASRRDVPFDPPARSRKGDRAASTSPSSTRSTGSTGRSKWVPRRSISSPTCSPVCRCSSHRSPDISEVRAPSGWISDPTRTPIPTTPAGGRLEWPRGKSYCCQWIVTVRRSREVRCRSSASPLRPQWKSGRRRSLPPIRLVKARRKPPTR